MRTISQACTGGYVAGSTDSPRSCWIVLNSAAYRRHLSSLDSPNSARNLSIQILSLSSAAFSEYPSIVLAHCCSRSDKHISAGRCDVCWVNRSRNSDMLSRITESRRNEERCMEGMRRP